jgi:hypothetical protein
MKNLEKKNMTLLEKAKTYADLKRYKHIMSDEELELAIGWARGEISLTQISGVLGFKNISDAYSFISSAFSIYIRKKNKK